MARKLTSGRKVGTGLGKGSRPTQFVKGKTGNPNGRGKGVRNLSTEIEEELNLRVPITENGTRKTITKRKAIAKQLVNKAASGDQKAIPFLLRGVPHEVESKVGAGPAGFPMTDEDERVLEGIVKRIRESTAARPDTASLAADAPTPPPSDPTDKAADGSESAKMEDDDADERS